MTPAELLDLVVARLAVVHAQLDGGTGSDTDKLAGAATALDQIAASIRRELFGDVSAPEEVGSLRDRAVTLVDATTARLGWPPRLTLDDGLDDVDPVVAGHAVAVLEEALDNAVRHAYAGSIEVALELAGDWLVLSVKDDGVGPNDEPTGGRGIPDMQARAERLGGNCEITPNKPLGTSVRWTVPLAR